MANFLEELERKSTFGKAEDKNIEYQTLLENIKWIKMHLLYEKDENRIILENETLQECVLESYDSQPNLTLRERCNYILGKAIVLLSMKKVEKRILSEEDVSRDVMVIAGELPFAKPVKEEDRTEEEKDQQEKLNHEDLVNVLLGIKEQTEIIGNNKNNEKGYGVTEPKAK